MTVEIRPFGRVDEAAPGLHIEEYNLSCYSWWHSCIAGRAPSYLREQCILVSSVPGRRHLRSADQLLLTIPRCHGATAQKCSFSVAGPSAWNRLPTTLREAAVQLPRGSCPGYDVKLIRCCPQYDVKLMWRHRGNDIVSVAAICVAAICAAAQLIFLFGRTRLAV